MKVRCFSMFVVDDYFKKVVEKYQIINPCDIYRCCDDMVAKLR